jgi:hypothetical protein
MSDFDKNSNKMRQRAASYGAITCGNVGFCANLEQNAPKGRKLGASYLRKCRILIKICAKCAKGPQVMAQLLVEMSRFQQKCAKGRQLKSKYIIYYIL